jgi:hypothetical protein
MRLKHQNAGVIFLGVEYDLFGGAERVRTAASQFCRLLP